MTLHHVELWVPDLGRAVASWGWLLTELGRRARARAVERYSLSDNLDRLLALYRELRPAAGAAAS